MPQEAQDEMQVRRLGWAGLEVVAQGQSLVIDLLEDLSPLASFVGEAHGPLPAPARDGALAALLTHLHTDHADAPAVARVLDADGVVLRPQRASGEGLETIATLHAENGLAETGVATRSLDPWETADLGPFKVTAVPAVDGFGDPQVSWVIEAGNRRIFHGGDTVFHGSWW